MRHNTWHVELPWLSLAFNTAVHQSTGVTPGKLFLGRELLSPLDVVWDLTKRKWINRIGIIKVARRYDVSRLPSPYQVGDMVVHRLRLHSSKSDQRSAKFQ